MLCFLGTLDIQSFGGAEEDRTPDLRIANATLSQLSYGPLFELFVIVFE
jgi:hypothetical protein